MSQIDSINLQQYFLSGALRSFIKVHYHFEKIAYLLMLFFAETQNTFHIYASLFFLSLNRELRL